MDRTYVERIKYRSKIIAESSDICIRVHDDARIRPAVIELYTYLLSHYLPKRFPQMFKLHYASFETGNQFMLENLVTKQVFATEPTNVTPTETLLKTLGMTVDEDFLFLLPEEGAESSDPKYVFQALVCICPSGWDPREKIGQSLASIHAPVPGYADKLESSMDRYFKNIEVGKYVKRSNWAITQHEELFMPDPNSNHAKQDEKVEAVTEIDPDKVCLLHNADVQSSSKVLTRSCRHFYAASGRHCIVCQNRKPWCLLSKRIWTQCETSSSKD